MIKTEVRKLAKEIRKSINYDYDKITDLVSKYILDKKVIAIFYPKTYELDLRYLEKIYKDKKFVYPKTYGENMQFLLPKYFELGSFNVYEPIGEIVNKDDIDLIIVPALGINKENYRVGYGKGYYDRYLADYKGDTLVVIDKKLVFDFKEEEKDIRIKEAVIL